MDQRTGKKTHRAILIADPDFDRGTLESIEKDPKFKSCIPIHAAEAARAQELLADQTLKLAGLFVSPKIQGQRSLGWISVIRCSFYQRPQLPVVILYDTPMTITEEMLRRMGVRKCFKKPFSYEQMLEFTKPIVVDLERSHSSPEQPQAPSGEFVSIRADDFLSGADSLFDVFVRISDERFVKILHRGDAFNVERVTAYLSKGVDYFYIKKEEQERYLDFCDKLSSAILKREDVPMEIKVSQTLNLGEQTLGYLKSHGLSESSISYAGAYARRTEELVKQLNPAKHKILTLFMADVSSYEHGVATTLICSLIGAKLDFGSSQVFQGVGTAVLLHDIGLFQMPEKFRDENERVLSPKERELYQTHPSVGAEMLSKIPGISATIVQAVAQHHERLGKAGFPKRVGVGKINRIAEVIGVSDEFVRLLRHSEADGMNPFLKMNTQILSLFSPAVREAFRSVFILKGAR